MPKARKAIKRGRPRKEGVPRTANGRIKYGYDRERPEDVMKTAREARQRVFGLTAKQAAMPNAGSALGRLQAAGNADGLSPEQRNVADDWEKLHRQYTRVREGLPPDPPSPAAMMLDIAPKREALHPDAEPSPTVSGEPDEAAIIRITRRWTEAFHALARHRIEHGRPGPYEMLYAVTMKDYDPRGAFELGNLRIACNILIHLWKRDG